MLESKLPIAARWGTWAPCGLRVETADPIRFLAGRRKRRLNQALSVLSLRLRFFSVCFALFTMVTFCVALFYVCVLVDLVRLSVPVQVTDWKDLSPK